MLLNKYVTYSLLILIWIPALMLDSTLIQGTNFDNKLFTSIIIMSLWAFLFIKVNTSLKKLMIIMVPLSWLGELICCLWLDMYNYRNDGIPLYVPFGHAVIYITGLLISNVKLIQKNEHKIKMVLVPFFILLFLTVSIVLSDTLSACLALLFFYLLQRKNYAILYLIMSLLVLYLEIIGTQLGTWYWHSNWWLFTTINPPVGAIVIYIAGDMLLKKLTTLRGNKMSKTATKAE